MNHKHFSLFFIVFFVTAFSFANPLISPSKPSNDSTSTTPETKQYNPVRISGGSQELFQQQGNLRSKLADVFSQLSNSSRHTPKLFILVLLLSVLYGILHAAGPGHRKTVIFSLYLTRQSPAWEPAAVGLLLAFLHGGSAILIMILFKNVAGSVTANTGNLAVFLEGFSYVILIAATLFLMAEAVYSYKKSVRMQTVGNIPGITKSSRPIQLVPFIISGIYPCPGAILIMVLCFTMNVLKLGIVSVLAMSLGMSIPIMAAAYLAWSGRTGLFRLLKNNEQVAAKIAFIIEMSGYTGLLLFSLYISWPFLQSLV